MDVNLFGRMRALIFCHTLTRMQQNVGESEHGCLIKPMTYVLEYENIQNNSKHMSMELYDFTIYHKLRKLWDSSVQSLLACQDPDQEAVATEPTPVEATKAGATNLDKLVLSTSVCMCLYILFFFSCLLAVY